ncbi:putative bifunctional diguanylate cyclase/phosphodiesterase [Azonexus sp. IMCC34839]|uniref:putative bifunctional diguanylate cyclase/phosphodiesterase n=1 Tax=Azonexus sp. IMCC34839 TaxID=3133695 RepID=UPI00399AA719
MPRTATAFLPRHLALQRHFWLAFFALASLFLFFQRLSAPSSWVIDSLLATSIIASLWLLIVEWQTLRRTARAYELAMQAAHDGFWEWDPQSKRLQVGKRLLEILGYHEDFLTSTHDWLNIVHPEDRAKYNHAVAEHLKGKTQFFYCEYRVRANDGGFRWIGSRGIAVCDRHGKAYQMVGSVTDITERRRYQDNLEFLASHDSLTGLPNRHDLARALTQSVASAQNNKTLLGLFFVDLDRFKDINDTLGHRAGDLLLQGVAQRLGQLFGTNSRIFRHGGDEFIILLPECQDISSALAFGEAVREAIASPFSGHDSDFFTSASIGLSLYPLDSSDADTLLRNGDTAMYAAKGAGGNALRQYKPEMNERLQHRVSLESGLRQAIARNELELYFQPKIQIPDCRICGAEALLRWHHQGRMIPPDQFIPVAEDTGMILEIGDWLTKRCFEHILEWQARGATVPPIAINLSPRQFWRRQPAQEILSQLAASGLPSSALQVEVTESLMLHADSGATEELLRLREAGLDIALDDFGTGYSSLSYLQRLPITALKIDRAFIKELANLDNNPSIANGASQQRATALVGAIIAMAHSLSLEVVAEGVETDEQLQCLKELGCDIAQGYLFSKPLPADEFFSSWLGEKSAQLTRTTLENT